MQICDLAQLNRGGEYQSCGQSSYILTDTKLHDFTDSSLDPVDKDRSTRSDATFGTSSSSWTCPSRFP